MMVFKAKGARTYKVRVADLSGASATLSTGTTARKTAEAVARFARLMRDQRRQDVLGLLVTKQMGLPAAYDAHAAGQLDALVARALEAARADAGDLRRHLDPWTAWKRADRRGARQADRYRKDLERLYPAGDALSVATFTAKELARRITALPRSEGTKARHKAAAMSFGRYLVLEGALPHNPARDAGTYDPGARRLVYYDRRTAQDVVARLPQPYAGMVALMVGFGFEWRAVARLRASDVALAGDPVTAFARGTKTPSRERTCVLLEHNRWVLPYVRATLQGRLGDALVFAGAVPEVPLDDPRFVAQDHRANKLLRKAHDRAVREAGAKPSTLHDWRHTFGVQARRDGYDDAAIAHNLGHHSTDEVSDRYGRFVPSPEDFLPRRRRAAERDGDGDSATTDATTPRKEAK